MMKIARKQNGMSKADAQAWVYSELDRMYPPPEGADSPVTPGSDRRVSGGGDDRTVSGGSEAGQIKGLGKIPDDWPELPTNASMSAEVGWVQANRLSVVEERPGAATLVHLERAHSPAPSWAALGWLETSIRSYAKYVDVAAKATSAGDGEAEVWRHERRAIAEVEAIINEMLEDDDEV